MVVVPQALDADTDDGLKSRKAIPVSHRVQHLVGLLLVARDDHTGAAVSDDVLQLDPRIGRIYTDRDRADHLGAEIGVEPFRSIITGDRDAVAGLYAERQETERHLPRSLVIMAPGITVPDAILLLALGQPIALEFGALPQELRQGDGGVLQG